jgi:hypothetical protein
VSTQGFTLNLASAALGLEAADFALADTNGIPVTGFTVDTSDAGLSYTFSASLQLGSSYLLSCPGDEYELSDTVTISVPEAESTGTVSDVLVTGFTLSLSEPVTGMTSANFKLGDASEQAV